MINQSAPSKRPGRPKSAEKAKAIQHAAVTLFMADGMEKTSMDAIAAAAGVSKQTVYSHFKNKDELFRSCVSGKIKMYNLDPSKLSSTGDLNALLQQVGRRYLTLLSDIGVVRMFRLMASQAESQSETARSFYEVGPKTTSRNIAEIIAEYLPPNSERAALADKITSDFLALVRADYHIQLILGTRDQISPDEMEAHVDHCVVQIRQLYDFN